MKRKLPPLNAVVAFESAGRNKSFKKAGEELCVTSSAISHQVRSLEEYLGGRLFERSTRTVALTDFGKRYLPEMSALLDRLEQCSENQADRRAQKRIITIQTTDSFAARWLIPRLAQFKSLHSDIDIKIITRDFRDALRSSEAGLGILFMTSKQRNSLSKNAAQLLFAEEIFPVCSPKLTPKTRLVDLADLPNFTLIHDDNVGVSWHDWISTATGAHANPPKIDTRNGPHYNHAHLALQAAELGGGITLASNVLASDALESDRLIAPFKDKMVTGCGYYLTQSENPKPREHCRPFTEWIFSAGVGD